MTYTYDPEADALYISLRDGDVAHSILVDEERTVDVDANKNPIGIEIGAASHGVQLEDLIERFGLEELRVALADIERTIFRAAART